MNCELCGRDLPHLKKALIEGSEMMVCPTCSRYGLEVKEKPKKSPLPSNVLDRLERREKRMREKDVFEEITWELVDDYPKRIRDARLRMNLTPEELGRKINEKKSIISKLESGSLRPDEALIKKLEKALDIKLKEKIAAESKVYHAQKKPLTLGDLIRIEKGDTP